MKLSIFVLFLFGLSSGATAQVGGNFTVKIIQAASGAYGGCAAWLDPDPKVTLYPQASCTNRWVTFDCEGQFTQVGSSKSSSAINYSNAQLAFITGKTAFIEIFPELSDDGYCYARRVDVYSDAP